jgi:hypothetical protein
MDLAKLPTDRNSPNTNTHERQVAKDVYSTIVDPALSFGATALLPGLPAFAATQALGTDMAKEAFTEAVAGPEKKRGAAY